MHRDKYSKLENSDEYLSGKHNSKKREELVASNKKLTAVTAQSS